MTVPTRASEIVRVFPFLSPVHPPAWLRRRGVWPGVVLAFVLIGGLAVASSLRSTPPAAAPALSAAAVGVPLTARGLVQPVRSARVGTLNGGVVRQLNVALDNEVTEQSVVAWVAGPAGTEVVTAPFAGLVTNVLVHEGDTVLPGTVIAVVADTRSLQVETVDVDEYVVSQVHVGLPVQLRVDALSSSSLAGTVSGVALQPQPTASGEQVYPVTIKVSAMPADVRAGMSVRVLLRD